MRLVTCRYRGRTHVGLLSGEDCVLPALSGIGSWPDSMLDLIARWPEQRADLASFAARAGDDARVSLAEIQLCAPIPRPPRNVLCLGLNYRDHIEEVSKARGVPPKLPEHPVVFTKATTSVSGPRDDIPYDPAVSVELDWEVELAVVIGRGGRGIRPEDAPKHVFGYTIVNDVTARDLQARHKQYFLGKSLDGACPMGPCLVTADEIPDPETLDLSTRVRGVLKQHSNTRNLIFGVAQIIAILSRGMTLEPGDVIATGTPGGVGFTRTPPEFLQPGDVVECEIERIGRIENTVREAPRARWGSPP